MSLIVAIACGLILSVDVATDFAALHSVPGLDVDWLNAVRERVAFRD